MPPLGINKVEYDIQIDFQLLGTAVLPEDISRRTGISPDVEMLEGERNKKLNLPRWNIWSIRSHAKSDEMADHWEELESKLLGVTEDIRNIAETGTAKLTILINSDQRVPSIMIPSGMSRFAGIVNAVIDIDHLQ